MIIISGLFLWTSHNVDEICNISLPEILVYFQIDLDKIKFLILARDRGYK